MRELSNVYDVAGSLSKLARGAHKSLSGRHQEYCKKCDVIYERRMDEIDSTKTSFSSEQESDANDEFDELRPKNLL